MILSLDSFDPHRLIIIERASILNCESNGISKTSTHPSLLAAQYQIETLREEHTKLSILRVAVATLY